jgi:uncharacterized protein (TIGR02147 family)
MNIFEFTEYKPLIKTVISLKKGEGVNLTNKELAQKIPIQATYLSKFFNDPHSHLKDETLFRLGKILDFNNEECDFLLMLKHYETSESPEHKEYLFQKINDRRREACGDKLGEADKIAFESMYLLNPKCMLVQMALNISLYRENPRLLCQPIKLSINQLIEILDLLEKNKFIVRGEDPLEVTTVNLPKFHIKSDQLMRTHQYLVKSLIPGKLQEVPENEKKSFLVTLNLDEKAYKQCLERFDVFLEELKKINRESNAEGVYQISFDLFKWC